MVDITKEAEHVEETAPEPQFDEKLKIAYPTAEEELIDFLNRCKLKNSEVMLCLRCSVVFDKETTKGLKGTIPKPKKMGKCSADHRPKFSFTKSDKKNHKKGGLNCVFKNFFLYVLKNCSQIQSLK